MSTPSELSPLFEPIIARFDAQAQAAGLLRAHNAGLAAEVERLRRTPHPAPPPGVADTGWTQFPPPDVGTGARVVYASSSTGKNTNDGLAADAPVETLAKAISLLRDGAGDRLLLKAGDTFRESFGSWTKSGRSPAQPLLIGAYGDGPRPRVVAAGSAMNIYSIPIHDLALVGLHLTAAGRDPASADFDIASPAGHGVRIVRPAANVLIEDCRIDFFSNNLTLTAGDAPGALLTNMCVRRCLVLDAWSVGGSFSGQGLYASGCDGLLLEDNVIDHNGWNERVPGAAPNIFRHNLYLSAANTNVAVRGNVISNAASHGLQLRSGGVIEDNVFVDNALHCLLAGAVGRFRRNVVIGGRDIDADNPRGFGLTLACADGRADRNLFAHKPATTGGALGVQRNDWTPPGPMRAAFVANVVCGWSGNGLDVTGDCDLLEFVGNDLQRCAAGRKLFNLKGKIGRCVLAANRYDTAEPKRERWFSIGGVFVPPEQWTTHTGDTSVAQAVDYPEAALSMPDLFLAAARDRPRGAWGDPTSAAAVSRRLRAAFEA